MWYGGWNSYGRTGRVGDCRLCLWHSKGSYSGFPAWQIPCFSCCSRQRGLCLETLFSLFAVSEIYASRRAFSGRRVSGRPTTVATGSWRGKSPHGRALLIRRGQSRVDPHNLFSSSSIRHTACDLPRRTRRVHDVTGKGAEFRSLDADACNELVVRKRQSCWKSQLPAEQKASCWSAQLPSQRSTATLRGLTALLPVRVDLQLLDLARERVAPDAEQLRRLDAAPAGVLQRRRMSAYSKWRVSVADDAGLAAIQQRLRLALERRDASSAGPAARASRRAARGGRSFTSTLTAAPSR